MDNKNKWKCCCFFVQMDSYLNYQTSTQGERECTMHQLNELLWLDFTSVKLQTHTGTSGKPDCDNCDMGRCINAPTE